MNKENVTLQDCLDMLERKGEITVIENGQVIGFEKEKAHQDPAVQSEHKEKIFLSKL